MQKGKTHTKVSLKMPETILNAKAFAVWLKAARKERGLTQEVLGEKVDVSGVRVYQWEKAAPDSKGYDSYPPLDMIVALATALHKDVREPLTALGVLKDETIEVTPDERELLAIFRALPKNVDRVALDILQSLQQLGAGKAVRKPQRKRPATGAKIESKAAS